MQTSKSRKPVYFSKFAGKCRKTQIPNKYLEKYGFDIEGYLVDVNGQRIIANYRSVGTPKYQAINNQFIYSGNYRVRLTIVDGLKIFLSPYARSVPVFEKLPVIIECELHTTPGKADWDLENFGTIYSKVLNDLLVTYGKLPDDSIRFVTKPGSAPLFVPIKDYEQRKFVFNFYHDNRADIQQLHLF